jgi:UDP-N-acetyl-D-galactosamine dehydrogenase
MHKVFPQTNTATIAVLGLGYVGLPLAVQFAKRGKCHRTSKALERSVIGFDVNTKRLDELKLGIDKNDQVSTQDLSDRRSLSFTNDYDELQYADVFIVAVPTPVNNSKQPDFELLKNASKLVGNALKNRSLNADTIPVVVYESTVYPGATEEICVPIIEYESQMQFNVDFVCGYSPERINPGDKKHILTNIVKITSGSTPNAAEWIDELYGSIISAGTYKAPSLKVAEAAKVIENTQRDINIAFANELSVMFRHMNIDTLDVLKAAGTKWNFLPFTPGLVGGHCIGVDPYYLAHKSQELGYYPEVIMSARRLNDRLGQWVAEQTVLEMATRGQIVSESKILILGYSFKENCSDTRNSRVLDIYHFLSRIGAKVTVFDPVVDPQEVAEFELASSIHHNNCYNVVIAAVAHNDFKDLPDNFWIDLLGPNGFFVDLKGVIPRTLNPIRL